MGMPIRRLIVSSRMLGRIKFSCLLRSCGFATFERSRGTVTGVDVQTSSEFNGMDLDGLTESQIQVREAIADICAKFPDEYWAEKDLTESYPNDLHRELARGGWIGICMPEAYGGSNLGISEATVMLQTIAESGAGIAGAQTIHANVYAMQPVWTFANEDQRKRWLPPIISGQQRACFGVTEPNSGLDTLSLETRAERKGEKYIINGAKMQMTSAQVAQKMVLLARTTPLSELQKSNTKPSEALSLFFADIKEQDGVTPQTGIELRRIKKMGGKAVDANQVFFDNFEIPVEDRIGEEGKGFKQILHGMNAERCLLAGLGYAALRRATRYASERVVFGHAIGKNQAIQHPLAQSWIELEAGKLLTYNAARTYDDNASGLRASRTDIGARCNAAKYFAAEAAFKACERAVMTHGGMGYSSDYHVERYLREVFVPRIAPVSREMILNYISQRVLGLPRSY
ncbi:acyl-CoA dehydrogenase NM domain-like protein [Ramaria rubella]|nr:acyl-CoA dehydrogenase NM domain-like protein [Ramaria rubella]